MDFRIFFFNLWFLQSNKSKWSLVICEWQWKSTLGYMNMYSGNSMKFHHFYFNKHFSRIIRLFCFYFLIPLSTPDKFLKMYIPSIITFFTTESKTKHLTHYVAFSLLKTLQTYYLLWICKALCVTSRANVISLYGWQNRTV